MSTSVRLNYTCKNAVVEFDTIEDDRIKKSFNTVVNLVNKGQTSEAIKKLPSIWFEFNAENMDSDYSEFLKNPHVNFDVNMEKDVRLIVDDEQLNISFDITFDVEAVDNIDIENLQKWLDENGGWMACTATGDWTYMQDEGGVLRIVCKN